MRRTTKVTQMWMLCVNRLTDSMVDEVLSDLSLEVLGQREGAHDPAVAVDHRARHAHALHEGGGTCFDDILHVDKGG